MHLSSCRSRTARTHKRKLPAITITSRARQSLGSLRDYLKVFIFKNKSFVCEVSQFP